MLVLYEGQDADLLNSPFIQPGHSAIRKVATVSSALAIVHLFIKNLCILMVCMNMHEISFPYSLWKLVKYFIAVSNIYLMSISGKPELSTVVYKVGECMQELVKLWKEFEGSQSGKNEVSQNGKNDEGAHSEGPTLEIRIPTEYVTATNRQVCTPDIYGS